MPEFTSRLPQDRPAGFRQAGAALRARQAVPGAEIVQDVPAGVSQSGHFSGERGEPRAARRGEGRQPVRATVIGDFTPRGGLSTWSPPDRHRAPGAGNVESAELIAMLHEVRDRVRARNPQTAAGAPDIAAARPAAAGARARRRAGQSGRHRHREPAARRPAQLRWCRPGSAWWRACSTGTCASRWSSTARPWPALDAAIEALNARPTARWSRWAAA